MNPDPEIALATPDDRLPVSRMLELYQHDLSDIWDQELDAHGEYGYELDRFWQRRDAWPYVFRVGGRYAGLALVDRRVRIEGGDFWMDQFFVLKKHRRRGIATRAAHAVFARHPGRWQVGQMPGNPAAQAFWRHAIAAFTGAQYAEQAIDLGWWCGVIQRFVSAPGDAA